MLACGSDAGWLVGWFLSFVGSVISCLSRVELIMLYLACLHAFIHPFIPFVSSKRPEVRCCSREKRESGHWSMVKNCQY